MTRHSPATDSKWTTGELHEVQRLIANAQTHRTTHTSTATLGEITLRPHQTHALTRIRKIIREFHGALLADEVGLGKTYVALALAAEYDHTEIIAPAPLLPMWRNALQRTGLARLTLLSMHAFSRRGAAPPCSTDIDAPLHSTRDVMKAAARRLVIIDEAHHLRTPNTQRYRAIADLVAGKDLLLLSATPIHNTAHDLRHLLALFAGSRSDLLSPTILAQVVVRSSTALTSTASTPRVREHPAIRVPHDRATLDQILALPAPLPARDGAVAGALIRLGLLRAWCSSDAALANLLRRRLLRGDALREALRAGRHPTHAELRTWIVGDHEVQLAFPELLTTHSTHSEPLLAVLETHLGALQSLLERVQRTAVGDSARVHALRDILADHPNTPIIAFSQFTHTVHALYRALSDIAGVGALTGMHARIASGRISRSDAIARFAPVAQNRPPPPPHQAIRLLLATDLLAEGVNLQDAGVVVHLDLPWTDALTHQRIGRLAPIGSPHPLIHVYRIAPPTAGNRALRLTQRLLHKESLAHQLVGARLDPSAPTPHRLPHSRSAFHAQKPPLRTKHPSAADAAAALHDVLRTWASPLHTPAKHAETNATAIDQSPTLVASVPARCAGWIARIHRHGDTEVITHLRRTGANDLLLWKALCSLHPPNPSPPSPAAHNPSAPTSSAVQRALGQLQRFLRDRETLHLVSDLSAGITRDASPAQLAARTLLSVVTSRLRPLQRRMLAEPLRDANALIDRCIGVGAERALADWIASAPAEIGELPRWLGSWRSSPVLRRIAPPTGRYGESPPADGVVRTDDPVRVSALLLLRPLSGRRRVR